MLISASSSIKLASRRKHCRGFTLMEMIGVMAIMSIMAAVLAPSVFDLINSAASDAETANLQTLAKALENSIIDNKRIPTQATNDWVAALSAYSDLPASQIEFNSRGFRRRLYVDPRFFTTVDTVFPGYTQSGGLVQGPNSPRIMLVSDLTLNVAAAPTTNATFSAIWDQTGVATIVESDDVKIERLHLAAFFHRVLLVNASTQQPAYRIEGAASNPVPAAVGVVDGNLTRFVLHNSNLALLANPFPAGGMLTQSIVNSDQSYRFETGGTNWAWVRL